MLGVERNLGRSSSPVPTLEQEHLQPATCCRRGLLFAAVHRSLLRDPDVVAVNGKTPETAKVPAFLFLPEPLSACPLFLVFCIICGEGGQAKRCVEEALAPTVCSESSGELGFLAESWATEQSALAGCLEASRSGLLAA